MDKQAKPSLPHNRDEEDINGIPLRLHNLRIHPFNFLGKGSFGKIFKVQDPVSKNPCALKTFAIDSVNSPVVKEVEIQFNLNHPNIVNVFGAWPQKIKNFELFQRLTDVRMGVHPKEISSDIAILHKNIESPRFGCSVDYFRNHPYVLCIIMELCECSLYELISNRDKYNSPIDIVWVKTVFAQLLSALDFIKNKGIVHNDLKPGNILIKNGVAKISDFGLLSFQQDQVFESSTENLSEIERDKRRVNSYRSPEIVDGMQTNHKSDIYSVGCIIFRLLSDNNLDVDDLFYEDKSKINLQKLANKYIDELDFVNVIKQMVHLNPECRPDTDNLFLRRFMITDAVLNTTKSRPTSFVFKSRNEWNARPPKDVSLMFLPVSNVIISHSVMGEGFCETDENCLILIRQIQNYHMNTNKWSDIAYQFVVGGNGSVYEGRGWNRTGSHTLGYNHNSIGICLMGQFTVHLPPLAQMEATKELIQFGVQQGYIFPEYKLYGMRDLRPQESPGELFYKEICKWPRKAPSVLLNNA